MKYWYFTKDKPSRKAEEFFNLTPICWFVEADRGNFLPLRESHFAVPVRDVFFRWGGWEFDPRENLKEYWVKFSWGTNGGVEIATWYALNKGDIRRNFMNRYGVSPRHIIRIVEIPQ